MANGNENLVNQKFPKVGTSITSGARANTILAVHPKFSQPSIISFPLAEANLK